eukprot:4045840-Alexandrium_andersonii.AAC.1
MSNSNVCGRFEHFQRAGGAGGIVAPWGVHSADPPARDAGGTGGGTGEPPQAPPVATPDDRWQDCER